MIKLPEKFEQRMKVLLKEEFSAYINSLQKPPVKGFRVNTEKISLNDFEKINPFGNKKIPYVENGFYLDFEKVGNHPFHHAGMVYVQEPAAMAPAECVDLDGDLTVLDMCAAPGGKSTQLRNKLSKNSVLVSNEIVSSRCKILTGNIERLGLKNCITTCLDSSKIAKAFPKAFDLIMVDAPCSGEGMFRKEPVAVEEWSEENVLMCAKRQSEILENAVLCLKDGGTIIYATCTFSLEENEMTVDSFLKKHPEFELVPVTKRVQEASCDAISFENCSCENIHLARRFYPHKALGEGQFMAVLKNKNNSTNNALSKTDFKKTDNTVIEFLKDTLENFEDLGVQFYNDKPIIFDNRLSIPERTAFSVGVTVGEVKKGYILPHHQFFMAYGSGFKRKMELSPDSEELKRFLHGEEIETVFQNGWVAVTTKGCTIGGGKAVSGRLKNHYPKGLRTK